MLVFDTDHFKKKVFLPGTRRSRTPQDTLDDFGRFMPQAGITRLANVTGLDFIGIPVVQAIRPNSRSLSVSQGKGQDLASAKVSAMMEAFELWHAERIELPCIFASYRSLKQKHKVVDVERLPRIRGTHVRPEEQKNWLEGWDLIGGEPVLVPFELVSMNTVGIAQSTLTFLATSNGLASGNHILEAMEHALCEVIERDTQAIDEARGLDHAFSCKIDLDTVRDPGLRALIGLCEAADLDLGVFEMMSDVGIPTFRAGLIERGTDRLIRRLGPEWGGGTHLSPVIAMSRAITEAAQARLTVIAASRDDNPPSAYQATQGMWTEKDARGQMFTARPCRPFEEKPRFAETDSFEGDLGVMLDALRAVGVEQVIMIDLTREDMNIPVVKVIVPEFEAAPFVPGYVEGSRAKRSRMGAL